MIQPEQLVGGDWAKWYQLTPVQRWLEAVKLFIQMAEQHGTLTEALEEACSEHEGVRWRCPGWISIERHSAPVAA